MVEPEILAFGGRSMCLVEDLMAVTEEMEEALCCRHSPVITCCGTSDSIGGS